MWYLYKCASPTDSVPSALIQTLTDLIQLGQHEQEVPREVRITTEFLQTLGRHERKKHKVWLHQRRALAHTHTHKVRTASEGTHTYRYQKTHSIPAVRSSAPMYRGCGCHGGWLVFGPNWPQPAATLPPLQGDNNSCVSFSLLRRLACQHTATRGVHTGSQTQNHESIAEAAV